MTHLLLLMLDTDSTKCYTFEMATYLNGNSKRSSYRGFLPIVSHKLNSVVGVRDAIGSNWRVMARTRSVSERKITDQFNIPDLFAD